MENRGNNELSYREALREIESLLAKIESPDAKIEEVSGDVKRALWLIGFCKEELRGYKEECEKLLERDSEKFNNM